MDKYQLLIQEIIKKNVLANKTKDKQTAIISEKNQEIEKKNQDLESLNQKIALAKERFEICRDIKKILRNNKKIYFKSIIKISLIVVLAFVIFGVIAITALPTIYTIIVLIIAAISIESFFVLREHKAFKDSNNHIKRVNAETNKEELRQTIINLEREKEQLIESIMQSSYEKEFAEKMINTIIKTIKKAEEVKSFIMTKRALELENNAQRHESELNAAFDKDSEILKLALKLQDKNNS